MRTTFGFHLAPFALTLLTFCVATTPGLSYAVATYAEPADLDGNTDLGRALLNQDHDLAWTRLNELTGDLAHVNAAGEGYVYLAARAGFPDIIRALADRRSAVLPWHHFFHFDDLDSPTSKGENAFFAAVNVDVLNELRAQYHRGNNLYAGHYPRRVNEFGQTFLHAAALRDQRAVVVWAVDRYCRTNNWTNSKWSSVRHAASALDRGGDALRTYTPVGSLPFKSASLFNVQDKRGQTALHLAVANQHWETARALASCATIDHDLNDRNGDRPPQALLRNLDRDKMYDEDAHAFFHFLVQQTTRVRRWFTSPVDRANHVNHDGQTAVQMAAGLRDPYFYKILSEYGDTEKVSALGETASEQSRKR